MEIDYLQNLSRGFAISERSDLGRNTKANRVSAAEIMSTVTVELDCILLRI